MQFANKSARQQGSGVITPMHILIGLASAPGSASESLSACGIDLSNLKRRASELQANDWTSARAVIISSHHEIERLGHNHLDVGHVLLAMIVDRQGDCATLLQSMGANLEELRAEIERRLPQPTFPLQQALSKFANEPRVRVLCEQLDDVQHRMESCVQEAHFETAAVHRDKKGEIASELEALLERLWHDAHG